MSLRRLAVFLFVGSFAHAQPPAAGPPQLTFAELITLSTQASPPADLAKKLENVLHTPVIDNSASDRGARPVRPVSTGGGTLLRTALWNIERGQNFDLIRLALSDSDAFERVCRKSPAIKPAKLELIREEAKLLGESDLILLNEVDSGQKRSDYHDVAKELAQALRMNYVFGVEFIDVDPFTLGIGKIELDDRKMAAQLQADIQADPRRYQGLHGNAILTRYRIRSARVFPLPVCHDWYVDEMKPIPSIEKLKRSASQKIFLEEISQERRRGGRMAIAIDLDVPDSPSGVITVVNTHLENKCKPNCRQLQIDNILEHIKDVTNPLILAGDMNTTGSDGSLLSISYMLKNKLKDYHFWGRQLINIFNPVSLFGADTLARYYRNYLDPTVRNVAVLAPNQEYGMFDRLRKFRFDDAGAFDFRGQHNKTINGRSGTLANSNERAPKVSLIPLLCHAISTAWWGALNSIGSLSSRWCLRQGNQLMAPEFARTMQSLNTGPPERISDHAPITVDLPLPPRPAAATR